MNLSPHFTEAEFVASETAARQGIDNTMPEACRASAVALCENILEPAREAMGPLHVNSGYRCYRLNTAIGGARGSQHLLGEAADLIPLRLGIRTADLFRWLYGFARFDQLIWEYGGAWCHVSYKREGPQRSMVLEAVKGPDGRAVYRPLTKEQVAAL